MELEVAHCVSWILFGCVCSLVCLRSADCAEYPDDRYSVVVSTFKLATRLVTPLHSTRPLLTAATYPLQSSTQLARENSVNVDVGAES